MYGKPKVNARSRFNDAFCGVEMGDEARDQLTNFAGIVVARSEFITGCNQVCLQPQVTNPGEWREGRWFDSERITIEKKAVVEMEMAPEQERLERVGRDVPLPTDQRR